MSRYQTKRKFIVSGFLLFAAWLGIFFWMGSASALTPQKEKPQPSVNQLTRELLDANTLSRLGQESSAQVEEKAKERLKALLALVDKDPAAVLRVAFSEKIHKAALKAAKPYLEQEVRNIEGTFEITCAMFPDGKSELRYALETDKGKRFIVNFAVVPGKLPQSGARVRLPFAIELPSLAGANHLLIPAGEKNEGLIQVDVTPVYPTTGVFKTLAILVNFQDQPTNQPWAPAAIKSTIADNVSGFDYEASSHQTSLNVDVAGWFTMPLNSTGSCDTAGIQNSAVSLANAAGYNTASYDRLLFIFPTLKSCGWAGLGYIGGGKTWGIAWINAYPTQQVIGHEMGHNFGLYHSHSRTCVGGTLGTNCTTSDYGDPADTMGNHTASHFNAAQKESLGWLNNPGFPGITTVQSSGIYTLEPYETFTMNTKALRIPKTSPVTNTSEYYYLEYRQPIGYDSVLNGRGNLTQGLLLHDEFGGGTGNNSFILNMNPNDTSFNTAAITPNSVFTDPNAPGGGVSVTVTSATSAGATVMVNFGSSKPTCTRANPSLSVTPSTTQWVNAGSGASYTVTLTNNDSAACTASIFNLTSNAVSGVTSSLNASSLNVAPGASAAVTLQIQSSATTANGTFSAGVTAVNSASPANTAVVTATLGVQSPCVHSAPSVTLSPSSQTGQVGGNVSYTLNVSNHDNAACGASNFNLSTAVPAGLTAQLSSTMLSLAPGGAGSATMQVNSSSSTAVGTYTLSATAINSGFTTSVGTANATYVVTNCSQPSYSYTVYMGFPFTYTVLINGSITCPDPKTGTPFCLVSGQEVGSTLNIVGSNSHVCNLVVQSTGSLLVNPTASNGCNVGLSPATSAVAGSISLPSQF